MQIQTLKLENFRNYAEFFLDFKQNILLIRGKNARGKTNLLEAIFALAIGKSYRLKTLDEAVKWGNDYLRIIGKLADETALELFYSIAPRRQKLSKINGVKKNLNDFVGNFLAVLFTPEDIDLVSASPNLRRRFLDILLSQVNHTYLLNLLNYQKILKHRNQLLKALAAQKSKEDELDFWDQRLAQHGSIIIQARQKFFQEIRIFLEKQYQEIAGSSEKLALSYLTKIKTPEPEQYLQELIARRQKDILLVETSIGPHRDDFEFWLEDKFLVNFGSRGEYRSAVLALKLAEVKFMEEKKGQKPVLLLDDVFSELDQTRQKHLFKAIQNQQTIITTTDDSILDLKANEMQVLEL